MGSTSRLGDDRRAESIGDETAARMERRHRPAIAEPSAWPVPGLTESSIARQIGSAARHHPIRGSARSRATAQTALVSTSSDERPFTCIRRLPITTTLEKFEGEGAGLEKVKAFWQAHLVKAQQDLDDDDALNVSKFPHRWRLLQIQRLALLRRLIDDPSAPADFILDIAQKLSAALSVEPPPTEPLRDLAPTEPSFLRDVFEDRDALKHKPWEEISNGFGSKDPNDRAAAVKELRNKDKLYQPSQGAIPRAFIKSERGAILSLIEEVRDADFVFSLERGGSLLADLIYRLATPGLLDEKSNIKIPKPTVEDATEYYKKPFVETREKKAEAEKKVHQHLLAKKVLEKVAEKSRENAEIAIKVVVVETAVSGNAVNLLLPTLRKLLKEFSSSGIKVSFRVLAGRETIKYHNEGQGTLKVRDPAKLIDPKSEIIESAGQLEIYIAQCRYLIGEDVGYQLLPSGSEGSKMPVSVFDVVDGKVRIMTVSPNPEEAKDCSRAILLDIIAGAYDEQVEKLLA